MGARTTGRRGHRREWRSSGAMLGALLVVLLWAAPAGAAWRTFEAEKMKADRAPKGTVVKGRFVAGMLAGTLRQTVTVHDVDKVILRVSGQECAALPTVRLVIDGERVFERPVRTGGWQLIERKVQLDRGQHEFALKFINPLKAKRCKRRLRIDSLLVHERVPLGAAVTWQYAKTDPRYRSAIDNFDVVTPENEMKWQFMEPVVGHFAFATADELVNHAGSRGIDVHAHTLVYDKQLPQWMVERRAWARGELEQVLSDYVRIVVSHFAGRVKSWDVINEPLNDWGEPVGFFMSKIGEHYLEVALRTARAADPDVKLYINEIGAEGLNAKSDGLYALVKRLRERGVPLDGVGFQYHTSLGPGAPTIERVRANFQRFADLGVDVAVSEMDVGTKMFNGSISDRLEKQADVYFDAARACADQPACARFTTWGISDKYSWLGPEERALPFDSALNPKRSWRALTSALR
jgi:endo-1,4-beta-xylanase